MRVAAALVSALALAAAAAGQSSPVASKPPASLRAGDVWTVTVRPPPSEGTRFEIRQGSARSSFPLLGSRARVRFLRQGRWDYGLRSRTRFRKLGSVLVRQRRLVLLEPFDAVEVGQWIVISDRRAGALYRLDVRTGLWARFASVREARELEPVSQDEVLVTSGERILRVGVRTGAVAEIARASDVILGLDVGPGDELFVSEGGAVVRLRPSGGREVLLGGLDGVHGVLLGDADRLLVAETFAGRVHEIDLAGGGSVVLAEGLSNPSSLASAPDGGLYVSEFAAGRVSYIGRGGSARRVATVVRAGALWPAADGSLLVTALGGDVLRVDPRTGRARSVLD
jgi:hypothetical protein